MSDGYMNGMRFNIATCTTRSGVFYYVICYENGMQETVSEGSLDIMIPSQLVNSINELIKSDKLAIVLVFFLCLSIEKI